jgi:hypothetical protein
VSNLSFSREITYHYSESDADSIVEFERKYEEVKNRVQLDEPIYEQMAPVLD